MGKGTKDRDTLGFHMGIWLLISQRLRTFKESYGSTTTTLGTTEKKDIFLRSSSSRTLRIQVLILSSIFLAKATQLTLLTAAKTRSILYSTTFVPAP